MIVKSSGQSAAFEVVLLLMILSITQDHTYCATRAFSSSQKMLMGRELVGFWQTGKLSMFKLSPEFTL